MAWFKREIKGIITTTEEKKETPDGIWNKCPQCKKPLHYSEQVENQYVCHYCGFHLRIGSKEYFSVLFDNNEFTELFPDLTSGDPLQFTDTKKYTDRLAETRGRMRVFPITKLPAPISFDGTRSIRSASISDE